MGLVGGRRSLDLSISLILVVILQHGHRHVVEEAVQAHCLTEQQRHPQRRNQGDADKKLRRHGSCRNQQLRYSRYYWPSSAVDEPVFAVRRFRRMSVKSPKIGGGPVLLYCAHLMVNNDQNLRAVPRLPASPSLHLEYRNTKPTRVSRKTTRAKRVLGCEGTKLSK